MPTYVYGCEDTEHPRVEIVHTMDDMPEVVCGQCGAEMHRIPQKLAGFLYPMMLVDWMCENALLKRAGKPRPNKYRVTRPGGLPGKDYHTRR
uniref:Putative regulatory protein FmdB zinc ribbon domain-containing protein n=1 Tax=viral metagenome TaxID=1070528 RepID=A0A6M3KRR1_9ZZZZ